jgi:hypothetical protein
MEDSKQYGQQEFNLPHDVVTLPSQGKFYKNKKKSVKVGYLTAQDENILISASRTDNVVNKLVKNKIYEPDLKVEDLLEGDLEAILIFLRNTSFGPDYNFVLRDPGTNTEFNHTVRLDELDFNEVKNEPNSEGLFEIKLPKSGNSVLCRLLTMGENEEINKLMSKYPPGVVPPTITTKLERQIVSIDGNQDREHIAKYVLNMPIMDSKFIRKHLTESEPRLNLNRTVTAPSGEEVTVRVTFGVEFFRPFF